MMDGSGGGSVLEPSVSPRSPPGDINSYGRRKQMVKVLALEREIGLLEEELKSVERVQPASTYCKEVDDFAGAKPDPFITITQEVHESRSFWKHLRAKWCSNITWMCCSGSFLCHVEGSHIFDSCISCNSQSQRCAICSEKTMYPECLENSCPSCACYCQKCTKATYNPCC